MHTRLVTVLKIGVFALRTRLVTVIDLDGVSRVWLDVDGQLDDGISILQVAELRTMNVVVATSLLMRHILLNSRTFQVHFVRHAGGARL